MALNHYRAGAGEPLVLLHGTAGSLENFAANFAAHARHFNCIAFDMIGSGIERNILHDRAPIATAPVRS